MTPSFPIPRYLPFPEAHPANTRTLAKTKPTYTRRSTTGGYTTLALIIVSTILSFTEFRRWYSGHETHLFSVEKGVSHDLQINLDIVIPMHCSDLHINVQDASGDRILAGDMLKRDATNWEQWVDVDRRVHKLESGELVREMEEDTHVGHVLGEVRSAKRRFRKTPRLGRGVQGMSCRVYGSLEGNKVQGDFHVTARGHGYMEFGQHLDHSGMLFALSADLPRFLFSLEGTWVEIIDSKACNSIQLLPHNQRALLRAPLPFPTQPARQDLRHNAQQLLQIPILPLRRTHNIYPLARPLARPVAQQHHLHESVRCYVAVSHRQRAQRAGHIFQVRHRADTPDDYGGEGESAGAGCAGGQCCEWDSSWGRVVLSVGWVGEGVAWGEEERREG